MTVAGEVREMYSHDNGLPFALYVFALGRLSRLRAFAVEKRRGRVDSLSGNEPRGLCDASAADAERDGPINSSANGIRCPSR